MNVMHLITGESVCRGLETPSALFRGPVYGCLRSRYRFPASGTFGTQPVVVKSLRLVHVKNAITKIQAPVGARVGVVMTLTDAITRGRVYQQLYRLLGRLKDVGRTVFALVINFRGGRVRSAQALNRKQIGRWIKVHRKRQPDQVRATTRKQLPKRKAKPKSVGIRYREPAPAPRIGRVRAVAVA